MDPHFAEYLAAVAGMHDIYGETGDDRPSEFHEVSAEGTSFIVAPAEGSPARTALATWAEPSEEFAGSGIWTV